MGLKLFAHRANYAAGVRAIREIPLDQIKADPSQDDWYKIASGKGVLVLHELRRLMSTDVFIDFMDSFGMANAGKAVTADDFQRHMPYGDDEFFAYWTTQKGLPEIKLGKTELTSLTSGFLVDGDIVKASGPREMTIDVTVEMENGEVTQTFRLNGERTPFRIETAQRPKRVLVDKYGWTAKAGDASHNIGAFLTQLDKTLIVYGTKSDEASNREAAEMLQRRIVSSGSNITVPVKADREVKNIRELMFKHVLLIGRPATFLQEGFGSDSVEFTSGSFRVDAVRYAHPGSAVIAAMRADGPLTGVLLAGLSAESTWNLPEKLWKAGNAQVAIFPANGKAQMLVLPRRELVKEFN